ncbi:hypothetical protein PCE1_004071 [Barthelona sp. PCE]
MNFNSRSQGAKAPKTDWYIRPHSNIAVSKIERRANFEKPQCSGAVGNNSSVVAHRLGPSTELANKINVTNYSSVDSLLFDNVLDKLKARLSRIHFLDSQNRLEELDAFVPFGEQSFSAAPQAIVEVEEEEPSVERIVIGESKKPNQTPMDAYEALNGKINNILVASAALQKKHEKEHSMKKKKRSNSKKVRKEQLDKISSTVDRLYRDAFLKEKRRTKNKKLQKRRDPKKHELLGTISYRASKPKKKKSRRKRKEKANVHLTDIVVDTTPFERLPTPNYSSSEPHTETESILSYLRYAPEN